MRLARVGIENLAGYLADGVAGWIQNGFELDYIPQLTVQDFVELRNQEPDRIAVLDVRELGEVAGGVIENSLCIPLGKLELRFDTILPEVCAHSLKGCRKFRKELFGQFRHLFLGSTGRP